MSVYIDHIKNDEDLPISYSINIKTLSTSKRPLTCCITTAPRISKPRATNQLNYIKPSICVEKSYDSTIKSSEQNNHRSSIHLPVTYSTSIHVPCQPPTATPRPPQVVPSHDAHHHYHHYHHYYHHRQSLSSRPLTTIKKKISPRPISTGSTRPGTTSTTTTFTTPESLSQSKNINKNIYPPVSIPTPHRPDKQPTHQPPPLPSYSALVWNWFHHTPTKPPPHHKGSQSDYSEICRHDSPSKRSLLFKLITSPIEKQTKSKHHRTCFNRKRLESSSSLPNKNTNYNE